LSINELIDTSKKIKELMENNNGKSQVLTKIKDQLAASEQELKEKSEQFNLFTQDLMEQLETLTGFFQIMYNHSAGLTAAEIKEFASRMDISVKNILLLATNLNEYQCIQENNIKLKPEKVEVHLAILENIQFFHHIAHKKNISVISIVDKGIKAIVDRTRFDHIIRNLISNGIKFTQEGGNVDISAKLKNDKIEIVVEDDGMGIPEDYFDYLFDPEIHSLSIGTNNEKGNGYGLYIVKKLVEKQGGSIDIESETHKGTKVIFTLPSVKQQG
jgi:two-component system, sensor histidine kinase and response regulator